MGFEIIRRKSQGGSRNRMVGVCISASARDRACWIRIGTDICERMGWKRGDKIGCAVGHGADFGWFCLEHNPVCGFSLGLRGRGAVTLSMTVRALHDGHKHESASVEHRIEDGRLLVKAPDWMIPVLKKLQPVDDAE